MNKDNVAMHSIYNCHFFIINAPRIGAVTLKKRSGLDLGGIPDMFRGGIFHRKDPANTE